MQHPKGLLTHRWIESAFPHEDHRLLNEAIPAITSSYIAPCVLSMVPETVDLVIMVSLLAGSPCQVPDLDLGSWDLLTWDLAYVTSCCDGLLGAWRCSRPYDAAALCCRSSRSMMGSAQRQTPWRTPQGRHASSRPGNEWTGCRSASSPEVVSQVCGCRLGLERLVRKLLRLSSRPAVLNLHYHPFNVYKHYYDKAQVGRHLALCLPCCLLADPQICRGGDGV